MIVTMRKNAPTAVWTLRTTLPFACSNNSRHHVAPGIGFLYISAMKIGTLLTRFGIPLLLLLALVGLQIMQPGWADQLEGATIDARFLLRGPEAPRNPIVIVALDEASFQSLGDLQGENVRNWPRARWADLIDTLASYGPRVIVLDVVFDTRGWDPGGDDQLAQAIARAGNVVLAAHLEDASTAGYSFATYSPPLEDLIASAAGIGVADVPAEADGVIRRLPLLHPWNAQILPSLATVAAVEYEGERINIDAADLGGRLSIPVRFRGPEGTFPAISLIDVLEGAVPDGMLEDALVLVGYTPRLEQDRHRTPFAPNNMPGIEIQAAAIDSLLAGDWLRLPPAWVPPALVALLSLLALALVNLPRPGTGLLAFLGLLLVYAVAVALLFLNNNLQIPLAAPLLAALLTGGVSLAERSIFAERDKRRLRQRFAGVMSPERLHAVMDHWDELRQSQRPRKQAAILFADIRGFTNASETLLGAGRSAEMVAFLNAYLDAMSAAVFQEGGVIYDVVGDGLMILFGLPESLPEPALHAVRAAARMARAAEALQSAWPLKDARPLQMGIGVHCGEVVDALVGSGRRVNYQVIGDPVNTAARIEAHCKVAMDVPRPAGGNLPATVTILLSAAVHERVAGEVIVDESIPPFEARGKSEPLRVVRLLGLKGDLP